MRVFQLFVSGPSFEDLLVLHCLFLVPLLTIFLYLALGPSVTTPSMLRMHVVAEKSDPSSLDIRGYISWRAGVARTSTAQNIAWCATVANFILIT